jgi:hypothetical protein
MLDVRTIATQSRKEYLSSLSRQFAYLREIGGKQRPEDITPQAFQEAVTILYRTGRPQTEIAALVQVASSTFYRWSRGDRLPPRPDGRLMFYKYMLSAMETLIETVKCEEEAGAKQRERAAQ